jgi:RNA polymerase subunit RPABC4/transcription elongation factor Spt4
MFENLQKELRRLAATHQLSVPIECDAEGYIDKECPSEACLFQFKIYGDDWTNIVRDEEVFCPSCRHAAPAKSWFTTAQIDAAKEYVLGSVVNGLNGAMRADAQASKRRQKPSAFLSIILDVKGGKDAVLLPVAAAEPMRLRTGCDDCACRYSYVGAAYFCPSCGKNSASHTFLQTLATIRTSASLGGTLRGGTWARRG